MLQQLILLAVVGLLPGLTIFRLPWWERDRRAALAAEERWFWYVVLSVAVTLSAGLALAAADRYTFQRLLAADVGVAAAAALAARGRLRLAGARRPGLGALLPLALVALGLWRFEPAAEYVMGGKDPGVYVSEGVQIAQRGGLVVRDETVAAVPDFARDLFHPSHERPNQEYYGLRFMGFFIKDPERGTVVGQFPHLYPVSIAVGYGIDGLTGVRRTSVFWAALGLLAVYFAAARVAGRAAAAAAAGLLALHVIQVWWAKTPNADMVMQPLLFATFLAGARAHVDEDRFFAPVAGVLLGLLLFLRFDAVIAVGGVFGGLAFGAFAGQRLRAGFVAPVAGAAVCALLYYAGPMRAYMETPILFLGRLPWWQYALLAAAAGTALAAWSVLPRLEGLRSRVVRWTPAVIAGGAIAAALYAMYLREPGGKLADYDAYALRTFVLFYLTVPGLFAALLGYALMMRRAFWRDPALFVTATAFTAFLFYKIRIVPEHLWMTRRFVPVILPAALIWIGAAACSGLGAGRWPLRVVRGAIGAVFLSLLGLHFARASAPLSGHVEFAGLIPALERFAGTIGADDLLIVEPRDAGGDLHVTAPPLAYIYARSVLVLNTPRPPKETFALFLDWARTRYARVLFAGEAGTDLVSSRYGTVWLSGTRIEVPEYATTPWHRYPRGTHTRRFDFNLYELTPGAPRGAGPFDLDVGVRDDLHVVRFHGKERNGERTFRWTQARSYVSVRVDADAREIVIWAGNGGRPTGVPAAEVAVQLDGAPLGTVRVGESVEPHVVSIPPGVAARASARGEPAELVLTTPTWNPRDVLGTADDRQLGVLVDRVAVR